MGVEAGLAATSPVSVMMSSVCFFPADANSSACASYFNPQKILQCSKILDFEIVVEEGLDICTFLKIVTCKNNIINVN